MIDTHVFTWPYQGNTISPLHADTATWLHVTQTQNVQTKVHYESAIQKWKELSGLVTLPQNKIFQSEWDKSLYEQRYVNLLQNTYDDSEKARILSVSSENASDWLHAVPIAAKTKYFARNET